MMPVATTPRESFTNVCERLHGPDWWWSRGSQPLLVLFWLGRLKRGEPRLTAFANVEVAFKQVLTEFGSTIAPATRQLPFWYLCNHAEGKLWQLESPGGIVIA